MDDKLIHDDKIRIESFAKSLTRRYVGRLAPTPSGYLHIGHAKTFWIAQQRSNTKNLTDSDEGKGSLILRIEDLDGPRCKPHYLTDMLYDMSWFDLRWTHGPSPVATDVDRGCGSNEKIDDDNRLLKKSKTVGNEAVANATTSTNGSLLDLVRFRLFHGVSLAPFAHVFEQVTYPCLAFAVYVSLIEFLTSLTLCLWIESTHASVSRGMASIGTIATHLPLTTFAQRSPTHPPILLYLLSLP